MTTDEEMTVLTKEDFKKLKLGEKSELSKVGLMKTAVTNVGLVKTSGIHSGGPISWPTQWGVNLLASTTGLVIRLKDATVKYTMEWILLIISEDKIDVVRIRPHKQPMFKVVGSKKLTVRNRRFVREPEPRNTSLEDQPPMSNMAPPPVSVVNNKKEEHSFHKTPIYMRWG